MYLRWKKKRRNKKKVNSTAKFTLSPVIVESTWEGGKSKQRVLKYLGAIREENIPNLYRRKDFWNNVNKNLLSAEMSPQQRALFVKKIEEVVPNHFSS